MIYGRFFRLNKEVVPGFANVVIWRLGDAVLTEHVGGPDLATSTSPLPQQQWLLLPGLYGHYVQASEAY